MQSKLPYFIPLGIAITCICGLIYLNSQQNYRQNANDPQIQMAEDISEALSNDKSISSIMPSYKIDIAKSLSPFIIVFDRSGKVATSNANLDNGTPTPPEGVFGIGLGNWIKGAQNRFTWQPKDHLRIAAVLIQYKGGYVLVGRSLREVETRENTLFRQVALAWIFTLIASFIATLVFIPSKKK